MAKTRTKRRAVRPVPNAAQPMCPYLIVKGAAKALAFYRLAFGAKELFRLTDPAGKIGHAEMNVGAAHVMLADEYPDFGALSPVTIGGTPVSLHLYVADIDRLVARATRAGATVLQPVRDEFFGDRVALLADPFGHRWHLATRREDVSAKEMQRRMDAGYAAGSAG
jgi:PhnB protein